MLKRKSLLVFSLCLWIPLAQATEQAELEQAVRQLESAKMALERAKAANNIRAQERIYFDYFKARQDIDLVIKGIRIYTNGNRAQPRDPRQIRTLSGEYDKVKK